MIDALTGMHVDVCFLATNAAGAELGLSTPDAEEAAAKRALARCATTVVALFDSSKFAERHVFSFASYDDLDVVVTDRRHLCEPTSLPCESHDVKVVIA